LTLLEGSKNGVGTKLMRKKVFEAKIEKTVPVSHVTKNTA
jgi:hypothetical protein